MNYPKPKIGANEVLVQTLSVGVDATDKDIYMSKYGEAPPGEHLLIAGHEAVGQVVSAGSKVKDFSPGDYVVPTVRRGCGSCQGCMSAQVDMCQTEDYLERGIKAANGLMSYKPIRDYGLISDTKTAALVGLDGSIDWLCCPRFDSPTVFGALLDERKDGCFAVRPVDRYKSSQEYIANTNVLVAIFETPTGHCEVVDFLAIDSDKQELCLLVTCQSGQIDLEIIFAPRFNYGRSVPRLEKKDSSIIAWTPDSSLELYSGIPRN